MRFFAFLYSIGRAIMRFKVTVFIFLLLLGFNSFAQPFKFAHVTDTHIGNVTGADDLRRTVKDINRNSELKFVIVSGDVTEFGSDEELKLAKQILDSLNKPYYVTPGNHDTNWSESGGNSFLTTFKSGTFTFTYNGYRFVGTGSGPYMRMGPGQIPREDIVWLDSVLNTVKDRTPIIYVNHYPQDSSLNNWYSAIDILKKKNIQLMLCGHGHQNKKYEFEGIPNVMGRSNLRAKDTVGGYNIVTIANNEAIFTTQKPLTDLKETWLSVTLKDHAFHLQENNYPRPNFAVNKQYPQVKVKWEFQDDSDLGVGIAQFKHLFISANTKGEVYALTKTKGKQQWKFRTQGKIYSTPYVYQNSVLVGSTDGYLYCLNAKTGNVEWKHKTAKAILGSPLVMDNRVYFGSSDGHFRALSVTDGNLIWDYPQVKGFVVTKPLLYQGKLYFGSWGNYFYALDAKTGKEAWKWTNGSANRMYSPAACWPVAANGKVFIVAPDRYMTAFDAESGKVIWRETLANNRVRESIGLSVDEQLVYAKTMDGKIIGVSTSAENFKVSWESPLQLPYELNPAAITSYKDQVFIPTHSGLAVALNQKDGAIIWKHKTSNCLINTIKPISNNAVMVSTMDGKISYLKYKQHD
jgi:outer membrane protein assembly factor BamB/predicted MPP superfamily phosphohydrolase